MDRATQVGLGLGFVAIIGSNLMEGGSPASLLLLPPMFLVLGGTVGAAMAGGTMADAKNALRSFKQALTWKHVPNADLVGVVVSMADKARREGLLTLEDVVRDVDDDFLKRGVSLAVDGTDPEELREILEAELDGKRAADRQSAKFFNDMGGYAPTIGIIGTVMGLVHVLENLSNPDELGHLIAGAFVATLWGVMTANLIWLPVGSRLSRIGQLESARMELVIEGVLAVQAGANPRVVAQRLESLIPAADRVDRAAAPTRAA
jgi:chemotaxis protein MotA